MSITLNTITRGAADWDTTINNNFSTVQTNINNILSTMVTADQSLIMKSPQVTSGSDFNTFTTTGVYPINSGSGHDANLHWPGDGANSSTGYQYGYLLVFNYGTSVYVQIAFLTNTSMYYRFRTGAGWFGWCLVTTTVSQ